MRVALLQLTSSDDPAENAKTVSEFARNAIERGAKLVLTPEVTNCVSLSRDHQKSVLTSEADDIVLLSLKTLARETGTPIAIGSLALTSDDPAGRFVNRSVLIDDTGVVAARYDKIHMFDVSISDGESYRESAGYRPGDRAVIASAAGARLGLSVCYDIRFPDLYRRLAIGGAQVLLVPSAFSPTTGAAHWHTLLRARAIENGAFVLAAAQTGEHPARAGKSRKTYGHSLAVSPWGKILADAGEEPGVMLLDLDLEEVDKARMRIPSLKHSRAIVGP